MVRPGPGCYFVTASTGDVAYRVTLDGLFQTCQCEDFELRGGPGAPCKHIFAARIFRAQQEAGGPAPCDQPGPPVPRKTYKQDWPNYNAAQVNEGYYLKRLLFDLCQTVPEPPPPTGRGRRPVPVRDGIYSACLKVYGGMSARRSMSDVEEARDDGFLTMAPHFNSVLNVLDDPKSTPILASLVRLSALPLASVETDFAVDSTGFSTCRYTRWYDQKYGQAKATADWVKCHAVCGVKTNVITAVTVLEQNSADSPQLPGLTKMTAEGFTIHEIERRQGVCVHGQLPGGRGRGRRAVRRVQEHHDGRRRRDFREGVPLLPAAPGRVPEKVSQEVEYREFVQRPQAEAGRRGARQVGREHEE